MELCPEEPALCAQSPTQFGTENPQAGHLAIACGADLMYNPLFVTSYTNQFQASVVFLKLKLLQVCFASNVKLFTWTNDLVLSFSSR